MIGKLHKSDNNLFVKCWQKPASISFTYEHWYLVNEKSKIPFDTLMQLPNDTEVEFSYVSVCYESEDVVSHQALVNKIIK